MAECTDCKFCVLHDTGYSNYTVMGTDFTCLKDIHPDSGDDMWGLDMKFAETCDPYSSGDPIQLDVDGETEYEESDLDPEVWELYKNY